MFINSFLPTFMPAINLSRLRIQTAKLMENFDNPPLFVRELKNLFEIYSDRTMRKGAVISPIMVLPAYRVPASVLRHLDLELGAQALIHPEQILALADHLWADSYFESRMLAASLLGRINPTNEEYLDILTEWVGKTQESSIKKALLVTSLARMRIETPDRFLLLMDRWANPNRKKMWSSAVQALLPLIKDKNFHNLPRVFTIIKPIIESAPVLLQDDLSMLFSSLYEASPVETTYFLRQIMTRSSNRQSTITLRRILPTLPIPLQDDLRDSIRTTEK
jgi:hypothetical protein